MKSAGKARNNGLYRHIRTSKEIIRNLLNDYIIKINIRCDVEHETAKREYLNIDVYGAAQQRFRFQFREFERNQDD